MPDFTLPISTVIVSPQAFGFELSRPLLATFAGAHTRWEVVAVDMQGTRIAAFPEATPGIITDELNVPMTASFQIPLGHPHVDELPLADPSVTPTREVQVYRNGGLLFWGPPVRRRANFKSGMYEYQAEDPLWYLQHRYLGSANRGNILLNPEFEDGDTHWGVQSCVYTDETNIVLKGDHSARLDSFSVDGFLYQQKIVHAGNVGLPLFLVAWVYIDATNFGGGQTGDRGVYLARRYPTPSGAVKTFSAAKLTTSTPRGVWTRLETSVFVPPNTVEMIEARLYAPPGTVWWDAAQVVTREGMAFTALGHGGVRFDQIDIAKSIVRHAQGHYHNHDFAGNPYNKSELYIGTQGALSGRKADRVYYFSEHQKVYGGGTGGAGALDEWPAKPNGFDFSMGWTPTKRWVQFHYPNRGTARPALTLQLGRNVSADNGTLDEDLASTANQVTIIGAGITTLDPHGASREEGYAEDLTALGTLTLEWVESAPAGTSIDALDNKAAARLHQRRGTVKVLNVEVYEPKDDVGNVLVQYIGVLRPGDIVPVDLQWPIDPGGFGATETDATVWRSIVNGSFRVARIGIDPKTDRMAVTLNDAGIGDSTPVEVS